MKKNDKHEPYCGCQNCKRGRVEGEQHWLNKAEQSEAMVKAWLEEPEKQSPPKKPVEPARTPGG